MHHCDSFQWNIEGALDLATQKLHVLIEVSGHVLFVPIGTYLGYSANIGPGLTRIRRIPIGSSG